MLVAEQQIDDAGEMSRGPSLHDVTNRIPPNFQKTGLTVFSVLLSPYFFDEMQAVLADLDQ